MPKIVDHDQRREEILDAAIRVIGTVGIDHATTRAIARESGYSTGVLSHYFEDKDELLRSVLLMTHRRFYGRLRAATEGQDALGRLWAMLCQNLPLDDERSAETRMEITFWPRAVSNPELARFQVEAASELLGDIEALVADVRSEGDLTSSLADADLAELLIAAIDGLSVHAELFPARLPPGRQRRLMLTQLRALGFRAPAGAPQDAARPPGKG